MCRRMQGLPLKLLQVPKFRFLPEYSVFSCDDGGVKNDDLKNGNDASRRNDGARSDDARLNDDDCLMSCAPNDEFRFRF